MKPEKLRAKWRAEAEQNLKDCIPPDDHDDILAGTKGISKEDVEKYKWVMRSQCEGKEERLGLLDKLDYLEECKDVDCALTISEHKDTGLGIHTTHNFEKGDVILEYCGRWIPASDFHTMIWIGAMFFLWGTTVQLMRCLMTEDSVDWSIILGLMLIVSYNLRNQKMAAREWGSWLLRKLKVVPSSCYTVRANLKVYSIDIVINVVCNGEKLIFVHVHYFLG